MNDYYIDNKISVLDDVAMDILIVFILCFLLWAILLGIPYLVAKKVNSKTAILTKETQNIIPPQAYLHGVFLYTVSLFILTSLLLQIREAQSQYAFKTLVVILMIGFTYQILRLFRK